MLAQSTLTQRSGDDFKLRPACPNCGRAMHPASTPGTDGTFRCGECGVWLTEAEGERAAQPH